MGNEQSRPLASGKPQTLKERSLTALAKYIKSGRAREIVLMVGAGISTSAGIPDFRSPETGLYANLARLDLPHPEAVFELSFFRENPIPFYTLAHELYPGRYKPTIAHCFIRLLHDKGLLLKCFTQNIDCLERAAGVPDEFIVEAHGSFARQRCIECKTPFDDDEMRKHVMAQEVPHCRAPQCNGLVKPDIVFFGEQLPQTFFESVKLPSRADLAIVMGTSLKVHPFATLPEMVGDGTPRVLINKERVGNLGHESDDVLMLGDCNDGVLRLVKALDWMKELEALWKEHHPAKPMRKLEETEEETKKTLEEEVDKLTREVDVALRLSNEHQETLQKALDKEKVAQYEANAVTFTSEALELPGHIEDADSSDPRVLKDVSQATESDKADLKHVYPYMDSDKDPKIASQNSTTNEAQVKQAESSTDSKADSKSFL